MGGGDSYDSGGRTRNDDPDRGLSTADQNDDRATDLEDDPTAQDDLEDALSETDAPAGSHGTSGQGPAGRAGVGGATTTDSLDDPARDLPADEWGGAAVDLEPADPGTVEAEFGLDLTDTEEVAYIENSRTDTPYAELSGDQEYVLWRSLREKHGDDPVDNVRDWIAGWKVSSSNERAQMLEWTAKKALGVERPVAAPGETDPANYTPDMAEVDVYRDLTRVSRAFLTVHQATDDGKLLVRRGVWHTPNSITTRLFEAPSASSVPFDSSALASHTHDAGVANHWARPYSMHHYVDVDRVALATDMVFSGGNGMAEGETHIVTDGLNVPLAGVEAQPQGPGTGDYPARTGNRLATAISEPQAASEAAHVHLTRATEKMVEDDVQPNRQGTRNALEWGEAVVSNNLVDAAMQDRVVSAGQQLARNAGRDVTFGVDPGDVG